MCIIFASKFVKTLRTLSEAELKSFELWLRSPWCNTNKNLIRVLEKIRKYYPTFDDCKLTKEKFFKQVLPKGKFSDRRINNLLSEAYLALERFLIFQQLDKKSELKKELLVEAWEDHDLEQRFLKDSEKEIKRIDSKTIKSWEDHLDTYRYHRQLYHHPNQSYRIRKGSTILQKMDEELDLLYLLEKATILNEKIFRNRILQNENHETEAALRLWHQATEHLQHPAIEFYKMRFAYTKENRLEQYWKLREAFMERHGELSEREQKVHLMYLLNDTALLIKTKSISATENLPLYQIGLKTNVLLEKGKISYSTYATIVGASNVKKTFRFTKQFIEEYISKVDGKFQEDCKIWAKAHTAYNQMQLNESLDFLIGYEFKIPYFQLVSRILNTQIYFDLYLQNESYEFYLFSYFDAFEKWMTREKIWSKSNKISVIRFIQKCRRLAKYYTNPDYPEKKIITLFDDNENVQSLLWLKEKQQEVLNTKTKIVSDTVRDDL
ncbi:MAG: hypothetical protein AAGG68_25110 [Bacteroidota bacterium]